MKEKPKLNYNDVKIIKGEEKRDFFRVEGGQWNLQEHSARYEACTHINCRECGQEAERNHKMLCPVCLDKKNREEYEKLPLAEWNGEDFLCLYRDEVYFEDIDSIEDYCEENEIDPNSLRLVLCQQTRFSAINIAELQMDNVAENWEPSKELCDLEEALNAYLRKASTNAWESTNKRVCLYFMPKNGNA